MTNKQILIDAFREYALGRIEITPDNYAVSRDAFTAGWNAKPKPKARQLVWAEGGYKKRILAYVEGKPLYEIGTDTNGETYLMINWVGLSKDRYPNEQAAIDAAQDHYQQIKDEM